MRIVLNLDLFATPTGFTPAPQRRTLGAAADASSGEGKGEEKSDDDRAVRAVTEKTWGLKVGLQLDHVHKVPWP